MKVLLLGATGLVGGECLRLLLAEKRISEVRVFSRSTISQIDNKIISVVAPFGEMKNHSSFFAVDAVLCALGTTIKQAGSQDAFRVVDFQYPLTAAQIAKQNGAHHYLLVSALGANAQSSIFYNRVKGELENAILDISFKKTTIIRPSLLLGKRKEFRFEERIAQLLTPLFPKNYKPVQASSVAQALVKELFTERLGAHTIESRNT
jgi:uncharacterized protein YbjT (DUF2867 family)